VAAHTSILWTALGDQVGAQYTFDDVSLIIASIETWNYTPNPYTFRVVKRSDGSVVTIAGSSTITLPANAPASGSPNKSLINVSAISATLGLMAGATNKDSAPVFLAPFFVQTL
jgi:hypothetical protein